MRQGQPIVADGKHWGMLERKFPIPILLGEVVIRMVRLLHSLGQGVDDHSCHSLGPAKLRHGGFQVILGSNIHISDLHIAKLCQISYLEVSNIIVRAHALYLHRTEHPANIIDVFNVSRSGLWRIIMSKVYGILKPWPPYFLQLEELGDLHQVLQLQSSLWHAVWFAPFLYPCNIILYLHCCRSIIGQYQLGGI